MRRRSENSLEKSDVSGWFCSISVLVNVSDMMLFTSGDSISVRNVISCLNVFSLKTSHQTAIDSTAKHYL